MEKYGKLSSFGKFKNIWRSQKVTGPTFIFLIPMVKILFKHPSFLLYFFLLHYRASSCIYSPGAKYFFIDLRSVAPPCEKVIFAFERSGITSVVRKSMLDMLAFAKLVNIAWQTLLFVSGSLAMDIEISPD